MRAISFVGLLTLAAPFGTEIDLEIDGPDEVEAMESLVALVKNGFGEELGLEPEEA